MRKITTFLFVGLMILNISGCVSRAEFDALESRVEVLEQKTGISNSASGLNNSGTDVKSLKDVLTNYDEVVEIITQEFGDNPVIEEIGPEYHQTGAFNQFGNGIYYVKVNNVSVSVHCEEFVATEVSYNDGNSGHMVFTPTYKELHPDY